MLETNRLILGDSLDVLKEFPDNSIHACVTDPPAGISFMGKAWDSDKGGRDQWIAWLTGIMGEVKRTLMPGGYAIVWALPITSHWTARAVEDAGFEIRDICHYAFGSGFPKSMSVDKAIDAAAGAEREVVDYDESKARPNKENFAKRTDRQPSSGAINGWKDNGATITAPATDLAREWDGFGTALKPAIEHWIVARKPLEGTVVQNVTKYGTGAIDIDGSRIPVDMAVDDQRLGGNGTWSSEKMAKNVYEGGYAGERVGSSSLGRFPSNLILDGSEEVKGMFPDSAGQCGDVRGTEPSHTGDEKTNCYGEYGRVPAPKRNDSGSASRFFKTCPFTEEDFDPLFYCAKASRSERDYGVTGTEHSPGACTDRKDGSAGLNSPRAGAGRTSGGKNIHPTVKPIALMSYLVNLVSRSGQIVIDPFAGSGTTAVACKRNGREFIAIEKDEHSYEIARQKIAAESGEVQLSLWG